jgi:hypothetical protein
MSTRCASPLSLDSLAAYALGELSGQAEAAVEEHYFGCAECTERLQWLQSLSHGVASLVRQGLVSSGVRGAWVQRAGEQGLRLRQYTIDCGKSVNCTVGADDDFVVVHLSVGESPPGELHVETEFHDLDRGHRERRDLPAQFVDRDTGEITYAFSGALVRSFPRSRWVMHVRGEDGRRLGPYTMNHVPGA